MTTRKTVTRVTIAIAGLLLLVSGSSHACPRLPWATALGGEWRDEAAAVDLTRDGGIILAGSSMSFAQGAGYGDAWVVKLRRNGQVEWQSAYGGEYWDDLRSIRQTADGGYIAAGLHYPPGGSQEAWVVRLAANGSITWQKTYGRSNHYDGALQVRPTADGGFIVAAWTQSYALGSKRQPWLLKLDANGDIVWQQVFNGTHLDLLFAVEQTADGGYILAGGTYSYSTAPGLYSDAWVMKLRADGSVDWQQSYGGNFEEVAYAVRQTGDGGYVVAAWSNSFDSGYGDIWLLRLDADGTPLWQQGLGGNYSDVPTALWTAADDGMVVAGYTASFGSGSYDGWLLALNRDGDLLWQKSYGGPADDRFLAMAGSANGIVATGFTRSYGAGEEDVWVVQTGSNGQLRRSSLAAPSTAATEVTAGESRYLQALPEATSVLPAPSAATVIPTAAGTTNLLWGTRARPSKP